MSEDPERSELDYEAAGKENVQEDPLPAFGGQSERRYSSTANDFHLAVQRAAHAAAKHQHGDEEWYELSRVQILVSKNPNVKIYSVVLTASGGR